MAGLESHRNHAYLEIIYGKGMGFGRDQHLNPFGPGGYSRPGRAPSVFWNRRFIKEEEEMDVSDGFVGALGKTPLIRLRKLSRSEAHTSELQSLMRNSYAVFSLQ